MAVAQPVLGLPAAPRIQKACCELKSSMFVLAPVPAYKLPSHFLVVATGAHRQNDEKSTGSVQPRQILFDPYGSVCRSLDRPHQAGAKLGPVESTVVL